MNCEYPNCVGGENGTHCREECRELPEPKPISLKNDFILAAFTVAVVLFVVWVLS